MKSLDEAIQHCLEKAEKNEQSACTMKNKYGEHVAGYRIHSECAADHRQLADWLRELKERREQHEVIRCKDCKYYYNTNPKNIPTANIICFQMHEDDYCSYAERRTDE